MNQRSLRLTAVAAGRAWRRWRWSAARRRRDAAAPTRRASRRSRRGARRSRATTSPPRRRSSARPSASTRSSPTPTGGWRRSSTRKKQYAQAVELLRRAPDQTDLDVREQLGLDLYKTPRRRRPRRCTLLEDVVAEAARLVRGAAAARPAPREERAQARGRRPSRSTQVPPAVGGQPRSADPHGARHRLRLRQGVGRGAEGVRGAAQDQAERHDRQADARLGARRQERLQPGHLALRAHPVARRRSSRASTTTSAPAT